MKFVDVENARKAYVEKRNKVKRQAIGIAAGIVLALVIVLIAINFDSFQRIMGSFGKFSLIMVMPLGIGVLMAILMPAIIVAVVVSVATRDELLRYKKAYKGYFVEQELNKVFTDIKYNHEAGLDRNILKSTGLIYTGDRYSSNDLTIGKYKNVNFMQADVHIESEHKDNDGHTHYTTVFRGRYMIFEFPKKFEHRLVLSPTRMLMLGADLTGEKMQRIETESVDFNKTFSVYAGDGMEALYILTPDFMERAQKLCESHDYAVTLYFVDKKMIVAINDHDDAFEPPNPNTPLDENAEIAKVTNEITLVTNIVDELKLTRKV